MAAVYLGSTTIGGAVVGLSAKFVAVGDALTELRGKVEEKIAVIVAAQAGLEAGLASLGSAKIAIRGPAVADFQAQLDASLAIQAAFGVQLSDPSVYLQGLLTGIGEVQLNLGGLVPSIALQGQLDASLDVSVGLNAKITAIDIELQVLDLIANSLRVQFAAIGAIGAALAAAVAAVTSALIAYASLTVSLDAAGARVFLYTGALSGLGAAIDAVSGSAGISGSADVRVPIVVIETADASRVAALNAVFKTS